MKPYRGKDDHPMAADVWLALMQAIVQVKGQVYH